MDKCYETLKDEVWYNNNNTNLTWWYTEEIQLLPHVSYVSQRDLKKLKFGIQ